jgi:hypothetical protein
MLSFKQVDYFNYAFAPNDDAFDAAKLEQIGTFYKEREVKKHKIIISNNHEVSTSFLNRRTDYRITSTIAKTALTSRTSMVDPSPLNLQFIKAEDNNIEQFTRLYLAGFNSHKKSNAQIVSNFKKLLALTNLHMFLIKKEDSYVGVNVLYQSETESLLAGGAVLPQYRNKGFHQQSLTFRINKALREQHAKNITAWAYNPSISLNNMLKLKMEVQETFNVYESCN